MSILFYAPEKLIAKSERVEHPTLSILLISVAIFLAIILVTHMGYMLTESSMKINSTCRDKIAGFEQRGMYLNSDQFKLALSYCDVR